MAKELKDLTKRADNYSQWYNDLVVKADLAEQSAVREMCIRDRSMISVSFMFVLFCGGIEYIMNYFGVTYCTVEEHFNID